MIITFYSYKGGVGRTMALANIAELFFRKGKKVLMVDWDLEAPGLERFFFKGESLENLMEKPGVVDMLLDYKEKMMKQPTDMGKNSDDILPFKGLDHFLVDIYPDKNNAGKLWFLPAGKRSGENFSNYANTILTFDWKDFYENWAGELYFEWLRRQFEKKADVILIDSRTGLTEMGGVCTYQLADTIILICGTNQQNIYGTYHMAKNFTTEEVKGLRADRPLNILVIPARIENAESDKLDKFKLQFIEKFAQFMPFTDIRDVWQMRIPYISKYAYSEVVAVGEGSKASAEDISQAYIKLYEILATENKKGTIDAIKSIPKVDRRKWSENKQQYTKEIKAETLDMSTPSATSTVITILHMSEIHFRRKQHEKNKTFKQNLQLNLVETVKAHSEKHKPPDFVVVTGDIAFSGKKHEYDEALDFFEVLKAILPEETQFLAIPGNHDVDRDRVHKLFSLHRIVIDDQIDDLLERKDDIINFINLKFKAFREFAKHLNPSLYKKASDYFWVKNFEEKNVSFLGLNSAWASESDNDRFNISLGYSQLKAALKKARAISNRVVLMHHSPLNWLKDLEYGKTRTEMFRKCQLLLHSHTHSDHALVFKDPVDACICLGTNASYTADKDGFIGFQFLEVEFIRKGTKVKVWPYTFSEMRNEFVPDRERWRGQEGKPYFLIEAVESIKEERTDESLVPLQIPDDYRNWVREFHSILPVEQLARKGEVVLISLPAVYIPLETANPFHKPKDEKDMKRGEKEDRGEPEEPAAIDIEELTGRMNCLLLRGKAGMGKTTLIKHLAYSLTHGSGPAALRGYLPIIVFLKDLWSIYERKLKSDPTHVTFELLLKEYFKKHRCPLPMETVAAYLSRGKALLMLDGLDEVPESLRGDLVDLVHRFQFQHKNNRFLITGRPHGIEGGGMLCFGKHLRDIESLDDKKGRDFISRWFRAVSGQATGIGEVTAADMIVDIQQHEHAAVFTGNPLLLTALCIFYLVGGKRIPDQRADLYDRIAANLLYRRFHDPGDKEKVNRVREFLMHLAYTMQARNIKSIETCDAAELLKRNHPQGDHEPPPDYKKRMEALFDEIEPMCGLLNRMASEEIEFAHLSFQEFLAAKNMLYRDIDYKEYLEKPWWKETILLYTGLMNLEMKNRSNQIVGDMIRMTKSPRIQLLGAEALRDFQSSKREESVVQSAKEKLLVIIESDANPQERIDAGEILGTLGDPRINALSPPMVVVEAGEFIRGSEECDEDDEKPIRNIYLDEFMMRKYPVTNQEFKAFIEDGGYDNKELWTPEGWQLRKEENISEPGYWHDRKWNGPNFPVVGVSWYEASAYANWLSRKIGDKYVLPSEAQWEKAARGSGGISYPWGKKWQEDHCNSVECGLRRTSPVGIFPAGTSPYGCMDMAGNVWEWCADWYMKDYYKKSPKSNPQGPSEGSFRVLRGGSWFLTPPSCRAASRYAARPTLRFYVYGFRLARLL